MSLRAHCSIAADGFVELVLRGDYEPDAERLAVRRWARGGAQGPPDMPVIFAAAMARVDRDAALAAGDSPGGGRAAGAIPESEAEAVAEMWALFRSHTPALPDAPPSNWEAALRGLLAAPRSRVAVTTLYADDAHTAGHCYAALRRALWRVVCGRRKGLVEAPRKCGLLTAPRWRHLIDAVIEPLRDGDPEAWPVVDAMRVLGVTIADPSDEARLRDAVTASLAGSVIAPTERLARDVRGGARKSTALFLLRRYVLPVLSYHQGAWGLLAPSCVWDGADAALADFAAALCPADLQAGLACAPALRAELALPAGSGGLGLPRVAMEAPLKAAELWPRDGAIAAGARGELVAGAYVRDAGTWARAEWKPRTMAAYHKGVLAGLQAGAPRADRRRREQNAMRGGTRAFDAVPWRAELSIDDIEFDVAWRLVFGGLTAEMMARVDEPEHGFTWRGERMEWALAQALHDCLPPGSVVTGEQPAPEIHPPGTSPLDIGDRADVDVLTQSGQRHVFDVRTVNVQCRAGLDHYASAEAHCAAIEAAKRGHYGRLYRRFAPFLVTLSGAVTQASAVALGRVAREVARADRTVLDWEPARWLDNMLHRLAVEMVKTTAVVATRAVGPPRRAAAGTGVARGWRVMRGVSVCRV